MKLFKDEESVCKRLQTYLIQYLTGKLQYQDVETSDIVINDVRHHSFYYEGFCKYAFKARMESYRDGVAILLHYLCLEGTSSEVPQVIIDRLNQCFGEFSKTVDTLEKISFLAEIEKIIKILKQLSNVHFHGKEWYKALCNAEHLANWLRPIKIIITLSQLPGYDQYILAQFDIPVLQTTANISGEFGTEASQYRSTKLDWRSGLQPWEARFWQEISTRVTNSGEMLQDILFTQPSTMRSYPDIPFYLRHGMMIFLVNPKTSAITLEKTVLRTRCSLISPSNKLIKNAELVKVIAFQNMQKIIFNELDESVKRRCQSNGDIKSLQGLTLLVPIYYQTLLTPALLNLGEEELLNFAETAFNDVQKDIKLLSKIQEIKNSYLTSYGINIEFKFIKTNHVINLSAKLAKHTTYVAQNDLSAIISCVCNYLEVELKAATLTTYVQSAINYLLGALHQFNPATLTDPIKFDGIMKAIFTCLVNDEELSSRRSIYIHLYTLLLLTYKIYEKNNDQISLVHLSAAEISLMTAIGGIIASSCKSGKDRNGLLQVTADALEIYSHILKMPPDFISDLPIYKKFYSFKLSLLTSGHQQLMASTNAQGAVGVKCISKVIGKDFARLDPSSSPVAILEERDSDDSEESSNGKELDSMITLTKKDIIAANKLADLNRPKGFKRKSYPVNVVNCHSDVFRPCFTQLRGESSIRYPIQDKLVKIDVRAKSTYKPGTGYGFFQSRSDSSESTPKSEHLESELDSNLVTDLKQLIKLCSSCSPTKLEEQVSQIITKISALTYNILICPENNVSLFDRLVAQFHDQKNYFEAIWKKILIQFPDQQAVLKDLLGDIDEELYNEMTSKKIN